MGKIKITQVVKIYKNNEDKYYDKTQDKIHANVAIISLKTSSNEKYVGSPSFLHPPLWSCKSSQVNTTILAIEHPSVHKKNDTNL